MIFTDSPCIALNAPKIAFLVKKVGRGMILDKKMARLSTTRVATVGKFPMCSIDHGIIALQVSATYHPSKS